MNDLDAALGRRRQATTRRRRRTLEPMRWFGAGWPDYTWLFGTDGEYTAYAAVAAGQFAVDQGPPAGAARRVGRDQPPQRQDRARGDPGRRGLLRGRRRRGQHRRVVEVPVGGGPGLAVDRRRALPARPLPGQQAGDGVRRRAGRGRGRLAGGSGQRRAARAWARRSWTTRSTPSAATPTSPTWPGRGRRRPRPGAGRSARPGRCWRSSRTTGGTAATPAPTPTRWATDNEKIFQRHWIGLTPTDAVLPRIRGRAGRAAGLAGARHGPR